MAEGFGESQPENEITVAVVRNDQAEAPVGVPFQPLMPELLASDFSFWRRRLTQEQANSFTRSYSVDPNIYRVFAVPETGRMSLRHIPLPLAHFEVGLRIPLDPAFVEFLVCTRVQPYQIHPNAVRTLFFLICLCRRLSFKLTMNILRMFFFSLRMSDNTL